MKRTLQFAAALFILFNSLQASAQISGQAPDWTLTDINGTSHNLYSYLGQGKIVFLDVSATWCTPCWEFHTSHALHDVYDSLGPAGSNKVMVFHIEADPQTTLDDLYGLTSTTKGNWVTGTPYPIISPEPAQTDSFTNSYSVAYFPLVYMICADRTIREVGTLTDEQLIAEMGSCPPQGVEEMSEAGNVSINPNPVTGKARLDISLARESNIEIAMMNVVGKVVHSTSLDRLPEGDHSISIDASDLAPGVYFVRVRSGSSMITKKIIKQ